MDVNELTLSVGVTGREVSCWLLNLKRADFETMSSMSESLTSGSSLSFKHSREYGKDVN